MCQINDWIEIKFNQLLLQLNKNNGENCNCLRCFLFLCFKQKNYFHQTQSLVIIFPCRIIKRGEIRQFGILLLLIPDQLTLPECLAQIQEFLLSVFDQQDLHFWYVAFLIVKIRNQTILSKYSVTISRLEKIQFQSLCKILKIVLFRFK